MVGFRSVPWKDELPGLDEEMARGDATGCERLWRLVGRPLSGIIGRAYHLPLGERERISCEALESLWTRSVLQSGCDLPRVSGLLSTGLGMENLPGADRVFLYC